MKPLLITAILASVIFNSIGQGLIDFRNNNLTAPPDRRVFMCGDPLVGTQFIAQLFHASDAANLNADPAVADTVITRFRQPGTTLPGTWVGGTRTLIGVANGQEANLMVRVWDSTLGTYADAVAAGYGYAQSAPFSYTPPTSPNPAPAEFFMNNFVGIYHPGPCVPEPSTLAFGTVALATVFICLRRRIIRSSSEPARS